MRCCNRTEALCFSPYLYRARNLVERFFNKIKHCRRVATRYDKLAANYLAFIQLASIRLWLRVNQDCRVPRIELRRPSEQTRKLSGTCPGRVSLARSRPRQWSRLPFLPRVVATLHQARAHRPI